MALQSLASQIAFLEHLSYAGIFIGVMLAGHVMPIPEDVFLLIAGYITAQGYAQLAIMIPIGILASFCVDTLFYTLSRKGSAIAEKLEKKIKVSLFEKYKKLMVERPFQVMFVSRFLSGFRFASPLVAGYVCVPWRKYLLYNAISSICYAPFFILLGYIFSAKIAPLISSLQTFRHIVFVTVLVVLTVGTFLFLSKKFFKKP